MRKGLLLTSSAIVVSGLVLWGSNYSAIQSSSENVPVANHADSSIVLSAKTPSNPDVILIDPSNGKEIQRLKASSISNRDNAEAIAESLEEKYDQAMVPAKLGPDGQLVPGKPRIVLDKKALVSELINPSAFKMTLSIPLDITKPNVTSSSTRNIDKVLLASYVTKFDPSVTGRVTNIQLSSQAINNVVLGPGDRFYYNLIVGERTEERGYQKAMEIVNKELVDGIGGGICQTSSTLYNAIDKAGLGIIELHHHSKHVGYVSEKRDATVSYGGKDFKFVNTKNYPVIIKTIVDKNAGTIEVQVRAAENS
ncbi:VanW family protein [Peribacillus sp. SCS-155]|uniref:VanW family protein n=1 Tax=Peribacillus sedimenti TaxID=3115297 RepID=UPI003906AC4A